MNVQVPQSLYYFRASRASLLILRPIDHTLREYGVLLLETSHDDHGVIHSRSYGLGNSDLIGDKRGFARLTIADFVCQPVHPLRERLLLGYSHCHE